MLHGWVEADNLRSQESPTSKNCAKQGREGPALAYSNNNAIIVEEEEEEEEEQVMTDQVRLQISESLAELVAADMCVEIDICLVNLLRCIENALPKEAVLNDKVVRLAHLIRGPLHVLLPHIHAVDLVAIPVELVKPSPNRLCAGAMAPASGGPHQKNSLLFRLCRKGYTWDVSIRQNSTSTAS